jgi:putative phosphoribosyl transferase
MFRFHDRSEAGHYLADTLANYASWPNVTLLALPRGGVPVGFEVSRRLGVPLQVLLTRKLGVPGHAELAFGAVAENGVCYVNHEVVRNLHIAPDTIEQVARAELQELDRGLKNYRGDSPPPDVTGCTVILVDDGLATGATMHAAVRALKQLHPARIVVAVPVSAPDTCAAIGREVSEIICALQPDPFYAVGIWYEDFTQTTDAEVKALLEQSRKARTPAVGLHGSH